MTSNTAMVSMLCYAVSRREYTKLNPIVVLLGKGEHQITSSWTSPRGGNCPTTLGITRSNITFVGTGKDTFVTCLDDCKYCTQVVKYERKVGFCHFSTMLATPFLTFIKALP